MSRSRNQFIHAISEVVKATKSVAINLTIDGYYVDSLIIDGNEVVAYAPNDEWVFPLTQLTAKELEEIYNQVGESIKDSQVEISKN